MLLYHLPAENGGSQNKRFKKNLKKLLTKTNNYDIVNKLSLETTKQRTLITEYYTIPENSLKIFSELSKRLDNSKTTVKNE